MSWANNAHWLTQWSTKLQHLIAGVPLLSIGMRHLREGETAEQVSGALEIVIALVVLLTFVVELRAEVRAVRQRTHAPHPRFGWFDLAAGALLLFEALHGHHVKPVYQRAHFYAGTVAILTGLLHHQLIEFRRHQRFLRIDDVGFVCRIGLRRLALRWADITSIQPTADGVSFEIVGGGKRGLNLKRYANRAEAEQALLQHAPSAGSAGPAPDA